MFQVFQERPDGRVEGSGGWLGREPGGRGKGGFGARENVGYLAAGEGREGAGWGGAGPPGLVTLAGYGSPI